MTQVKNGRKFSSEFSQATVVTRETRLLAQTPNEPVENVTVGQIVDIANEGMATNADLATTNENVAANAGNIQTLQNEVGNRYTKEQTDAQISEAINEVEQTIEEIEQTNEETYATKTGEYKALTAGFAYEILGDGQATEEQFSFRPTGGPNRNVRDGSARIEVLKGSSVVWNQLVDTDTTSVTLTANHKYITNIGGTISLQSPTSATTINVEGGVDKVTDLTQMFGAGNEPTTVEEFYQRLPKGVDLDAYNEGEIIDGNYGAIKTTGVNQYNGTFAKVIGGLTYYLGGTYTSAGFTTTEGGATEVISIPNDKLYTPAQNGYIYAQGSDICISLVWPEYGEFKNYESYKPFVRDLSWANKYFPATINGETKYGMRSAGSARDEIRFNSTKQKWEAVQRVGVVDLGSLNWRASSTASSAKSMTAVFDLKSIANNVVGNITSEKYTPNTADNVYLLTSDKIIAAAYNAAGNYISVYDSEYSTSDDVSSFKASLQGVMLNYELATPIINEITENVNFAFDVSDRGTEELVVAEGVQSAPIVADIVYQPNVLATIKNVPDLAAQVAALQAQMASMAAAIGYY